MKIIGYFLIYDGVFIIYMHTIARNGSGDIFNSDFFIALLIAIPQLLIGKWLVNRHEKNVQKEIDKEAQPKENEMFFLYLRPFSSTNAYKLATEHLNFFSPEMWENDGYDDIERVVARTLQPTAKLVALGAPGEHIGAARILTTENDWEAEVIKLAHLATLIIIIPSHQNGTLWELAHIVRENYLTKTIFIMPPSDNRFFFTETFNVHDEWELTKSTCHKIGLALPDLIPEGAFFKVFPNGAVSIKPMPNPDPVLWMEAFQFLILIEES